MVARLTRGLDADDVPGQSGDLPEGLELVGSPAREDPRDAVVGRLATVINDTLARLESSFKELQRFTADASHELRSPLTGVKGFVQAMLSRWGRLNDEQKKSMLEQVQSDAGHQERHLDGGVVLELRHLAVPGCRDQSEQQLGGAASVLVRQRSEAACIENRTWGYDGRSVWVDQGCAGDFEVVR